MRKDKTVTPAAPSILIVDDDPTSLMMLCEMMSKEWKVRPVPSGEEAVQEAVADPPDLILLDVMMPGKNGFEICTALKGNPATQHIPIILVTALSGKQDRILGLQAGADDFLSKPIDRSELAARTRNLLRVKRYADLLRNYNEILERQVEERTRELEKTQQQLMQQEKMASMGVLMAGIAHEINNPIGFISSNLESMRTYGHRLAEFISLQDAASAGGAVPPATRDTLSAARRTLKIDRILEDFPCVVEESLEGAGRVKQIVSDMKLFSHANEDVPTCADINHCLERTLNLLKNELKYKARITCDFGPLPQVLCLPNQLNQVFMNLLVNASHAIQSDGQILVRTWQADGRIGIAISDNGCGIPAEILHRIFDPFFTTKELGKGTGLGLSISYDIIRKHGGEIDVESEVGRGTTFTVTIPVNGTECRSGCGADASLP